MGRFLFSPTARQPTPTQDERWQGLPGIHQQSLAAPCMTPASATCASDMGVLRPQVGWRSALRERATDD
jgi:hypothetical protein